MVQQRGYIQPYIAYFDQIIMDLTNASEEELVHAYIYYGLKPYIKGNVKAHVQQNCLLSLTDIMTLLLQFEDAMKSGVTSVTKHASPKPSRQRFGGNQGNSSSGAVLMELGHMKPQDKSRRGLSKIRCYNCGQTNHYAKNCSQVKKGNLGHLDTTRGTSDNTDVTQSKN